MTVLRIDWTYAADDGLRWEIAALATILNRRPLSA